MTTAQKKGILKKADLDRVKKLMLTLNKIGEKLGKIHGVTALTDVTGFGLLGHLIEICEGSNLSAIIDFEKIPVIPDVKHYLDKNCLPGGTTRNFDSYGKKVNPLSEIQRNILCDPQTSGGLLVAIEPRTIDEMEKLFEFHDLKLEPFGELVRRDKFVVYVE